MEKKLRLFLQECSGDRCCFTLLVILVVALIGEVVLLRRRNKNKPTTCKLSSKINRELKKNKLDLLKEEAKNFVAQLYRPTKTSMGVLVIVVALLFLIARLPGKTELSFETSNHYQNLIAVLAGIGTVVFALMIFLAESLRDSSDRAKILLKQSWLYPLTVLSIFSLAVFLWGDAGIWSIVVILFVAGLTTFALYRVFELLLSRALFLKKEQEFWKDRIKASIREALKLRIGNNIFLKTLEEDDYNLEFSFWREERENYKDFKLSKLGEIKDIDLCKLDNLGEFLEELANKQDKSFRLSKDAKSVDKTSLEVTSEYAETQSKEEKPIKGYLYKKLGDNLDGERQEALSIPVDICSEKDEKIIQDKLEDIYCVGGKPGESLREELGLELSSKKDAAVGAIRDGRTGVLEEIANLYVALVESFLEVINEVGGGYDWEQAKKERGAIIGGWDEVKWVSKHLYDLLLESISTENKKTISILSYTPISIAIRSIKFSDHFVFQEFIPFQTYLYRLSGKVENKEIREFLLDRSWRYLEEMGDFYVASQMDKKEISLEKLESYKYYAIDILRVFLSLLKLSFDQRQLSDFQLFQKGVVKVFRHFKPSKEHWNVWHYDLLLEKDTNLTDEQKRKYKRDRKRQKLLESIEQEIKERKSQLLFGIGSWIFYKFQSKNFDNRELAEFWNAIKTALPGNLKELTSVYQKLHVFGAEQFWGWDWWELEEKGGEGEVVSMNVGSKIDWLYAIRAVELIGNLTEEQIKATKLDVNRDLVYLIEKDDAPVRSKLLTIKSDVEKWSNLIPEDAIGKIDTLLELFDNKVSEQKEKEVEILARSGLDDSKVENFFSGFIDAFNKSVTVRRLFNIAGVYKQLQKRVKSKVTFWGFNQINDKAAFIKKWHVHYSDLGKHYGEELGSEENGRLYKELSKNIKTVEIDGDLLGEEIVKAIKFLNGNRRRYLVALTTMFIGDIDRAKRDEWKFLPHYTITSKKYGKIPGFVGQLEIKGKKIPVLQIRVRGNRDELCLIDLKKLGQIIQHLPHETSEQKKFSRGNFLYQVVDLNSDNEARNKILEKNPEWLQKHDDPELYLKQKVIVKVLERLELRVKNKKAGIKIIVSQGVDATAE